MWDTLSGGDRPDFRHFEVCRFLLPDLEKHEACKKTQVGATRDVWQRAGLVNGER
jgi:hypothetical protein